MQQCRHFLVLNRKNSFSYTGLDVLFNAAGYLFPPCLLIKQFLQFLVNFQKGHLKCCHKQMMALELSFNPFHPDKTKTKAGGRRSHFPQDQCSPLWPPHRFSWPFPECLTLATAGKVVLQQTNDWFDALWQLPCSQVIQSKKEQELLHSQIRLQTNKKIHFNPTAHFSLLKNTSSPQPALKSYIFIKILIILSVLKSFSCTR